MTGHPRQAATAQLLVGAAIIGTNGLMVRLAEMAPTAVAFWRMLLAGLMLGALVLARHGWRKVAPDTRHPKTDPALQEDWKKNSRRRWMPC